MKRSEMLTLIDKAYDEFFHDWLENGTKAIGEDFENFVPMNERILQAIEKAGMKPPSYEPFNGKILWQWEPEE